MSHFRIYIPTRTLFGAGMVKELHNQQLFSLAKAAPAITVDFNGLASTWSNTAVSTPACWSSASTVFRYPL